jgi:transposase-like protein
MDETTGTEIDTAPEVSESSGPVGETTEQQSSGDSGGNPAWDSLRSKLDPVSFHSIQDDLKNFDKNAESRISSLNQQLKEYNELGSPEQLQNYATIAQRLDTEPEIIYNALGEFLKQNGRMPETEAELQDAVDDEEATSENGEVPTDPRLAQLEQQQQQMQEFLAQQEKCVFSRKLTQLSNRKLANSRKHIQTLPRMMCGKF